MAKAEEKNKNYAFYLHADLSEYEGKWIAIVDGKVVASGDRADEVMREAESKHPDKEITLAKVPTDDILVL